MLMTAVDRDRYQAIRIVVKKTSHNIKWNMIEFCLDCRFCDQINQTLSNRIASTDIKYQIITLA